MEDNVDRQRSAIFIADTLDAIIDLRVSILDLNLTIAQSREAIASSIEVLAQVNRLYSRRLV